MDGGVGINIANTPHEAGRCEFNFLDVRRGDSLAESTSAAIIPAKLRYLYLEIILASRSECSRRSYNAIHPRKIVVKRSVTASSLQIDYKDEDHPWRWLTQIPAPPQQEKVL